MNFLEVEDLSMDISLANAVAGTFVISHFKMHKCYEQFYSSHKDLLIKSLRFEERDNFCEEVAFDYPTYHKVLSSYCISMIYSIHAFLESVEERAKHNHAYGIENAVDAIFYSIDGYIGDSESSDIYFEIHNILVKLLPVIIRYKVNTSRNPFFDSGKVFEFLSVKDQDLFLFNLDILT